MTPSQAAQDTARKAPRSTRIGQVVFIAFLGLAAIAWIGIAVAANARTPGIVGVLTAVFGGFFVALLIAAVGGGVALKLSEPETRRLQHWLGDGLDPDIAAIISDLEVHRVGIVRQVKERSAWRVPACAAVGLCLWTLAGLIGAPGGVADFVMVMIVGGIIGYVWSSQELAKQYARLYKQRVLPRLAASFGEITWRPAVMPDLARLQAEHIFRAHGAAHAENELAGTYRGLPIHIVELKLDSPDKKKDTPAFDGLLIDIDLRLDTGATTAVVSDGGDFGKFRDRLRGGGRQQIKLEDPEFERVYEVYGSDQVAARALLHPALMEKLLKLGRLRNFGAPVMLASGSHLTIAAPKTEARSLFASPSFTRPADSRETLVQLREDIASVLAVADAVVDLDYRFGAAAQHP
jgi:hypothetical protein